jgi:hypothetical protein
LLGFNHWFASPNTAGCCVILSENEKQDVRKGQAKGGNREICASNRHDWRGQQRQGFLLRTRHKLRVQPRRRKFVMRQWGNLPAAAVVREKGRRELTAVQIINVAAEVVGLEASLLS